jgi:hypothetical protein
MIQIPMYVHEAVQNPNRHDQKRRTPCHTIIKMQKIENKEKMLKTTREKTTAYIQITHKDHFIPLSTNKTLRNNNCQPRVPYLTKLFFIFNEKIRTFQDKDKLKQFISTKAALQKILQGIFHTEEKINHKYERPGKNKTQKGN